TAPAAFFAPLSMLDSPTKRVLRAAAHLSPRGGRSRALASVPLPERSPRSLRGGGSTSGRAAGRERCSRSIPRSNRADGPRERATLTRANADRVWKLRRAPRRLERRHHRRLQVLPPVEPRTRDE